MSMLVLGGIIMAEATLDMRFVLALFRDALFLSFALISKLAMHCHHHCEIYPHLNRVAPGSCFAM